ncbi:unnamed protein product [Polarella glacialis]|uniref:Carrier domain-containing protein n=1 Tax=Polarella glacialis TaxID=89957 RepID=A0A813DGD6_POLGL|nr:unnamed protein product [Polarella glacialis]
MGDEATEPTGQESTAAVVAAEEPTDANEDEEPVETKEDANDLTEDEKKQKKIDDIFGASSEEEDEEEEVAEEEGEQGPQEPRGRPTGQLLKFDLDNEEFLHDQGKVKKQDKDFYYVVGTPQNEIGLLIIPDMWGWNSGRTRRLADYLARALNALVCVPRVLDTPTFEKGFDGDGLPEDFNLKERRGELRKWLLRNTHASFVDKIKASVVYLRNNGVKRMAMVSLGWGSWIYCYVCEQIKKEYVAGAMFGPDLHVWAEMDNPDFPVAKVIAKVPGPIFFVTSSEDSPEMYSPGGELFEVNKAKGGRNTEHLPFSHLGSGFAINGDVVGDRDVRAAVETAFETIAKYFRKHLWPFPLGATYSSLRLMAKQNDTEVMEALLNTGIPPGGPDSLDEVGQTTEAPSVQVVKALLAGRVDIESSDANHRCKNPQLRLSLQKRMQRPTRLATKSSKQSKNSKQSKTSSKRFEGVEYVSWKDWSSTSSATASILAASPYPHPDVEADFEEETEEELVPASNADEIPDRVLALLSEVADEAVDMDSDLTTMIDSLGSTLVLNKLQIQFGVVIAVTDYMELGKASDLVNRVLRDLPSQQSQKRKVKTRRRRPVAALPTTPAPNAPAVASAAPKAALASREVVAQKVLAIMNEVVEEDDNLQLDSNLLESIDSLASTLVMNKLQLVFGVVISVAGWMELQKIEDVVNLIMQQLPAQAAAAVPELRATHQAPARSSSAAPPPRPTRPVPQEVSGLEVLREGSGPTVCFVQGHPEEAEELAGTGQARALRVNLAAALAPCHVFSLPFDEEGSRCNSFDELVSLYCRRVVLHMQNREPTLASAESSAAKTLAVVSWSLGCPVAHALAIRLQRSGVGEVRLLLFDGGKLISPPSALPEGQRSWCGGDSEAVFLAARASGARGVAWAAREAPNALATGLLAAGETAEDLQMRLFWEQGAEPGNLRNLGPMRFSELSAVAGRKADRLRELATEGVQSLKAASSCFGGETHLALQRSTADAAAVAARQRPSWKPALLSSSR